VTLRHAAATHTGRRRPHNEDAHVVQSPLFAVADGMGGPRAGEVASRLAAEALRDEQGDGSGEERVISLIQTANRRIYQRSSEDAEVSGMGTTMTVALVEDSRVVIGHVGDSRAYLVRDSRLEQLTEDHSLVNELVRSGKLSREEAESHPQRSVITRALGSDPDVDIDIFTVAARSGDVFLLCSDGLTTMVRDDDILATVERHRSDLEAAARALIDRANRGGGEDNITVVCFTLVDGQEPEPVAPVPRDIEDTLTALDGVPTVQEPAVVAAPAQAVPDPEPRGTRLLAGIALLALVAVVALLLVWGLAR